MEDWSEIRRRVLVEGVSRRQILRESKLHWLTVKKILEHSEPPGYRQQKPPPRRSWGHFWDGFGRSGRRTKPCRASIGFLASAPRRAAQAVAASWDLLVVDETHHLEWSEAVPSREYEVVEELSRKSEGLL